MKDLKRGTPGFGIFLGLVLAGFGGLIMWLGFWRALLLAVLFAVGYFLGAVTNRKEFVKETVDRVVPRKEDETINFRREVQKQQAAQSAQYHAARETEDSDDETEDEE